MKDVVKKVFFLGLGAASMTKNQAERIVRDLVKKNAVSIKEGKDLLKRAKKHAAREGMRVKKFAAQEAKRIIKGTGGISKAHVSKVKKGLKAIDRELSSRGKKTLKKILKDLSR